jgi:hypothetical protein
VKNERFLQAQSDYPDCSVHHARMRKFRNCLHGNDMTYALKRRQDNYLTDPFLKELNRVHMFMQQKYPAKIYQSGDKVRVKRNEQTDQTAIWLAHLRKLYIEQHHAWVLEDSLYNQKGLV